MQFGVFPGKSCQPFSIEIENIDGRIIVPLYPDPKKKYDLITFKGLCEYADRGKHDPSFRYYVDLYRKFMDYDQLQIVEWPQMPIRHQVIIFNIINFTANLSNEEKIYCPNYGTKILLKYIFARYGGGIGGFLKHCSKSSKIGSENDRFRNIRFLHNILYLAFGKDFTDQYSPRQLAKTQITESAELFEKKLEPFDIVGEDQMNDSIIRNLGIEKQVALFGGAARTFDYVLSAKQDIHKGLCKNVLRDVIVYFIDMVDGGRLTFGYIKENWEKFYSVISEFNRIIVQSRPDLLKSTSDRKTVSARMEILNNVVKANNISIEIKNNKLTEGQKSIIKMEAPSVCPVEGIKIGQHNYSIDHKDVPKSKGQTNKYSVLSKEANSKKGAQTQQDFKNMSNYMQEDSLFDLMEDKD